MAADDLSPPIVVVPTYQEREMLPRFLQAFAGSSFHALVVDDGSPDGTGEWAEEYARGQPWLHVLRREGKAGLGGAYRAGFAWCLRLPYVTVGQMDCDLSHPIEALERLAGALRGGADLALGSRFTRGAGTVGWPWWRKAQSYAACIPARVLLRTPVSDLTGGFKLWRADALRRIEVESTVSQGVCLPDRDDAARVPGGAAGRRGAVHVPGARARRVEDVARDQAGGGRGRVGAAARPVAAALIRPGLAPRQTGT